MYYEIPSEKNVHVSCLYLGQVSQQEFLDHIKGMEKTLRTNNFEYMQMSLVMKVVVVVFIWEK